RKTPPPTAQQKRTNRSSMEWAFCVNVEKQTQISGRLRGGAGDSAPPRRWPLNNNSRNCSYFLCSSLCPRAAELFVSAFATCVAGGDLLCVRAGAAALAAGRGLEGAAAFATRGVATLASRRGLAAGAAAFTTRGAGAAGLVVCGGELTLLRAVRGALDTLL